MFYTCSGKQLFAQRCPDNLVYNPSTEECDWPEFVNCGNKTMAEPESNDSGSDEGNNENEDNNTTVGPINDNPAEARTICAQDESDGILIAHENCDHFYICNLFVPITVKCGKDLYFNANEERCDWPNNVDCGDRVIPTYNNTESDGQETLNLDPNEAPEICARDGSDGVLIAHENCNQYYKCYQGEPNALKCSGNHMYNSYKEWCDWAENVDCGERIVPGNNDSSENGNPTMASEICAREESDGILVAHEICSQFFKCSHGVPIVLQCGNGLQYNADLGICNWPSQVDCGDRQQ
ncbi:jg23641 [Pararge aegeria aegeria]|uniref:Jg23641 protein n=2 Tax=Pararge aegeria TaxID=116150 RepID=A0A8S4QAT2_9NEOP|nr:jg23641 [Pararge aegeria aegeria]